MSVDKDSVEFNYYLNTLCINSQKIIGNQEELNCMLRKSLENQEIL